MILSSRPTDRRQLIEEAAGITKYKARRRAAELKLEAAQQNLTRIDDIVFEVEKQRGSLKRQAAKARRYTRLRDEMRRWEKVLFARRYRMLGEVIESARARLAETREQEAAAAARLAEVENELGRLRIELAEAEAAAARVREAAHARELEINRRQQQIALDTQQAEMLQTRSDELELERATLDARREPERLALEERRSAARRGRAARDESAATGRGRGGRARARRSRRSRRRSRTSSSARGEVYAVMNTVTALTAALRSGDCAARARGGGAEPARGRGRRSRTEHDRAVAARAAANDALARGARDASTPPGLRGRRASRSWPARAPSTNGARAKCGRASTSSRRSSARLRSLEELDAHRAGFSDAARMVLVQANGHVGQMGALADVIEVEPRYERAVEACLGDLLQHVLVRRHEHAAAGLALVRQEDAGRCGFVVVDAGIGSSQVRRARRVRQRCDVRWARCRRRGRGCRASCASRRARGGASATPSARR